MSSTWGLGPRNYIWVTWDQKTYEAVRLNVQHDKRTMNDKNNCFYEISSLVLGQFLAFFKTISFDFAMLILHC